MDRGGVEGGEGNRVGWRGEGGEGSCLVGEDRGRNTAGCDGGWGGWFCGGGGPVQ